MNDYWTKSSPTECGHGSKNE